MDLGPIREAAEHEGARAFRKSAGVWREARRDMLSRKWVFGMSRSYRNKRMAQKAIGYNKIRQGYPTQNLIQSNDKGGSISLI